MEIDATYVREALSYCPETGQLTWNRRPIEHFRTVHGWKVFNKCDAGKVAGHLRKDSYLTILVIGKAYLAHRLVWLINTGEWPSSFVDHINRVKTDNRMCNLRLATKAENAANSRTPRTNTTGVKGVSPCGNGNPKYRTRLKVNGRVITCGHYETIEEASAAIRKARSLHHGEFCNH